MTAQPFDLDAVCAAALHRLQESLNRSAGQHLMHLRRAAHGLRATPTRNGGLAGADGLEPAVTGPCDAPRAGADRVQPAVCGTSSVHPGGAE